jgi:hypothetical protein
LRTVRVLYLYVPLRAADAPDHPFTILEARGIRARTYRVRYCFESPDVPASPFAQEMWHASWQIKTKGGIRDEAVDATVREFELKNTPGMTPRQVRLLKGEWGVASRLRLRLFTGLTTPSIPCVAACRQCVGSKVLGQLCIAIANTRQTGASSTSSTCM